MNEKLMNDDIIIYFNVIIVIIFIVLFILIISIVLFSKATDILSGSSLSRFLYLFATRMNAIRPVSATRVLTRKYTNPHIGNLLRLLHPMLMGVYTMSTPSNWKIPFMAKWVPISSPIIE